MLNYLDKLSTPEWLVLIIVLLAVIAEICKGVSAIWGVIAPKIFKISTKISRKKEIEKIILSNQEKIQKLETEQKKDREVSKKADKDLKEELNKTNDKLDKIGDLVLNMRIENMRAQMLGFGSNCRTHTYSREQYLEIFELYNNYEELLKENGLTNGKVEITMEIIHDRFKWCEENKQFLESKLEELHIN